LEAHAAFDSPLQHFWTLCFGNKRMLNEKEAQKKKKKDE
jgi:hypothetical protein